MLDRQRLAREIGILTKARLTLLGLCLVTAGPAAAQTASVPSSQDPQSTAAQGAPSQQTSSSQGNTGTAATPVSTSHYAAPEAGDSASAAVASAPAPTAAPAPAATTDADAGWTPATAVNSWLPHWLRLSGEFRDREEGRTGYGFKPGSDDAYGLTRVRLGFDITPTSWLHGFVQARDSEVIGANPKNVTTSMKDVFDLNQAYIEFRNGENGWFSLKTGRQELLIGDERLIGRSNWSNATRSFDAVRLTLRNQDVGALLDVFASSVVKDYPTSLDQVQAGRNLYGFNLGLSKLIPRASIEPYVYLKSVPTVTGVDKVKGDERLYTSGVRWAGTIPGGFDYRARYSIQSGHFADSSIHAWAWYTILGYTIPKTRFEPRFSIEYNYASGNRSIGNPVVGTFDLLYPTTHQWDRITDLFGEENIRDLKPGFDFRPVPKLKVRFVLSELSLASRYDSLYDTTGAVLVKVPKGGALSRDIGKEGDVYGTYDVNRRLQLGAGFGHLYAGQFIKQNTPGSSASYPYGFLDYHF